MAPGGETFDCPAGKPVLDAAHAANVLIAYSCRAGQCRSCLGRLLRGRVEYPDGIPAALERADAEAGYVLFCSARAVSDLTIELIGPEFLLQST